MERLKKSAARLIEPGLASSQHRGWSTIEGAVGAEKRRETDQSGEGDRQESRLINEK